MLHQTNKHKMNSDLLIQAIVEKTRNNINQVEKLKSLDLNLLTWKQNPSSWCILECIEHLNLYGDFYLPEIKSKILSTETKSETEFKSGILGKHFAKSMLPKEKLNKMKTFSDKNPLNAQLEKTVLERFIAQQITLLDLLDRSRNISLNKTKINTSISNLLKIKLGDTFQFLINHNIRHLKQIDNIQKDYKNY